MVKIASFNVENLFARAKALNTANSGLGEAVLASYQDVNALIMNTEYSVADKARILELLVKLDIYTKNTHEAIRRNDSLQPKWAWLRKNRERSTVNQKM